VTAGLRALASLAALVVVTAAAASGRAGAIPDSAARAALQATIGHLGSVRVVGSTGGIRLLAPVVRDDGLHMRAPWKPPRPALFVSKDTPAPERPVDFVPWSAIEQVQVRRSRAGTGFLAGAAFGAGLVGMLVAVYHRPIMDDWSAAAPIVLAGGSIVVGAGATVGLLLGSFDEGWRTVYPPPALGP